MNYTSTRNSKIDISAAEAIVKGISADGGLFVPKTLPAFTKDDILALVEMSYQEKAFTVLKPFLDFGENELRKCVNNAYHSNFRIAGTTRVVNVNQGTYMLELWHGPTAAFKDMALQILPELLNTSKNILGITMQTMILVATSGDTGKAALEGFKDAEGTEIVVFYPVHGVSDMQKLQMDTQEGENVHVFAVKGNFDDCQNAVKTMFADTPLNTQAKKVSVAFSSANSINWGRLCPQIVYYFSAYADMIKQKVIKPFETVNICVPTGNFGNILAAYYAKQMGLPIGKLICASNSNNVLSDFIKTGTYDRKREFKTTMSPSMDILISSNLERLLYHLCGEDDAQLNSWIADLNKSGKFTVDKKVKTKLQSLFYGGWCDERDTAATIKKVFTEDGYLMDTHTAVAYKVLQDYIKEHGKSKTKTIIASTASPYKFSDSVYSAIYGEFNKEYLSADGNEKYSGKNGVMYRLNDLCRIPIPTPLVDVENKKVRFMGAINKDDIKKEIQKLL